MISDGHKLTYFKKYIYTLPFLVSLFDALHMNLQGENIL